MVHVESTSFLKTLTASPFGRGCSRNLEKLRRRIIVFFAAPDRP